MLTNISWGSYIITVGGLLLLWYLVLILKYYYSDIKKIFSGEKRIKILNFKNRPFTKLSVNTERESSLSSMFSESRDTLDDTEELSKRIIQVVEESDQKQLSKEQFQNYLRMVLEQYPYVKNSSLKKNINKLIVSECEKYPQLNLTLSEADSLWDYIVS